MATKYWDSDKFFDALRRWRAGDSDAGNICGGMAMDMVSRVLAGRSWRGYPTAVKDEMRSRALAKMSRGMLSYDLTRGPSKTFSYMSRCVWTALQDEASKYYRDLGRRLEIAEAVELAGMFDPPRGEGGGGSKP